MTTQTSRPLANLIGRGAAWSGLNAFVLRLGSFTMGIVVARLLAPREFGVFAVALTVYGIIVNLSELGVSAALVRETDDVGHLAPTVFTIALTSCAALAAVMFLGAPAFADLLGAPAATSALRVMSFTVLLSGFTAVPHALLVRSFRQDKRFLVDGASFVVANVALVLLALGGSGALALAWSRVIALAVEVLLLWFLVSERYLPGWNASAARWLLHFGLPLTGASVLGFMVGNTDNVLVAHALGATRLGFYTLAYNISGWPISVLTAIVAGVATPAFARVRADRKQLSEATANLMSMLTFVAFPAAALIWALAEPLVHSVYGGRWVAAVVALRALALFGAVRVPIDLLSSVLIALGRTRSLLAIQAVWLAALIPALILGIHMDGLQGAGLAHFATALLVVLPVYLVVLRRNGVAIRPLAGSAARPLAVSVLVGALAYAVGGSSTTWAALVLGGVVGAAAYALLSFRWIIRIFRGASTVWNGAPAVVGAIDHG